MIVYNITTKLSWAISDDWLLWQRLEHIPQIMATQLFDDYKIFRLLEPNDNDGPTFTVQYFTSLIERYQQYINEFEAAMRQKAFNKWGDGFVSFRTLMQVVN
jgi:Domain of unknown function (DUF4286)